MLLLIDLLVHCYILQIQEHHHVIRHSHICVLGVVLGLTGEASPWGLKLEQRSSCSFTFLFPLLPIFTLSFLLAFHVPLIIQSNVVPVTFYSGMSWALTIFLPIALSCLLFCHTYPFFSLLPSSFYCAVCVCTHEKP